MLAGLIQAPSGYDPVTNPVGARERRSQVLSRMVVLQVDFARPGPAANEVPLPTTVHDAPGVSYTSFGYYVDEVVNQLLNNPALGDTLSERESALFTGGLKIYTNEDPPLAGLRTTCSGGGHPVEPRRMWWPPSPWRTPGTGTWKRSWAGPTPLPTSSMTRSRASANRARGSSFSPSSPPSRAATTFTTRSWPLLPVPSRFPGVPLQSGYNLSRLMNNDPGDPNGVVTLVEATALSINCAFLRLAHEVTLQKVIDVAKSMGVSDPTLDPGNPSLVIGTEAVRPIEMSAAYATVADGGIYHAPTFVNRVVDRIGAVIYDGESPAGGSSRSRWPMRP